MTHLVSTLLDLVETVEVSAIGETTVCLDFPHSVLLVGPIFGAFAASHFDHPF